MADRPDPRRRDELPDPRARGGSPPRRRREEADAALVAALRELGRRLDVPVAPDLRPAVRVRLAGGPGPARLRFAPDRPARSVRAAAVLVAFAVLLAGTLAASPRARAAVVEVCTFGAVRLHSSEPPGPLPGPMGERPPRAYPGGPRFGGALPGTSVVTLAEARRLATFQVLVPAGLGQPDQVLVRRGSADFVALRYGPGPGRPPPGPAGISIELEEFAGTLAPYLDKYLTGSQAERVPVGADPGMWINGPHEVAYTDESGRTRFESARLAGHTLLWQHGQVTLRLEGDLTRAEAVAIAQSIR
jgi:hypothetical protein